MKRRHFLGIIASAAHGLFPRKAHATTAPTASLIALPGMQNNPFPVELVMNSRRSYHSGYSGDLPMQVLANVLWAATRAPMIGDTRTLYLALPTNLHRYNANTHRLEQH